jgi:type IV secretion system protein VirB9
VLVKPVSADLPMNNIVIATDRRTYHIEAHPTRETYMAAVSWRYPQDEFVALRIASPANVPETPRVASPSVFPLPR